MCYFYMYSIWNEDIHVCTYMKSKKEPCLVQKGFVPVLVGKAERGEGDMERIMVPAKLIHHPFIVTLLQLSAEEYGYHQQGLLKIRFDAHSLKTMLQFISNHKI